MTDHLATNYKQRLAANPRLLFWAKALVEVKILNAIIILFYLARGVTLEQVYYLGMIYAVDTLLFEIPSGYLADHIGRKKVIMLGVVAVALIQFLSMFATGFPAFAGIFLLMAFGDSMFSGTEEALVYDSLKALGDEKHMTKSYGQLSSARHISKIVFPTLGALIATNLLEWQFDLALSINAVLACAAIFVVWRVAEPKHESSVEKTEIGIYTQSLQTIWAEPLLMRAALNKTLIFICGLIVWRVYQPYLSSLGVSVAIMGLYYFLLHLGAFITRWYSHHIAVRFNLLHVLQYSAVVIGGLRLIALFIPNAVVIFLATLVILILVNGREPLFSEAMNQLIHSRSRATTLSNLNILKAIIDIPAMFICSLLAAFNLTYPLWVCVLFTLTVVFLVPIRERDLN